MSTVKKINKLDKSLQIQDDYEVDEDEEVDDRDNSNDSYWYTSGGENSEDDDSHINNTQTRVVIGDMRVDEDSEDIASDDSFTLEVCEVVP